MPTLGTGGVAERTQVHVSAPTTHHSTSPPPHSKCQRLCVNPQRLAPEPILDVPAMAALLKAEVILLVFSEQTSICLWFSGATNLELFSQMCSWVQRTGRSEQVSTTRKDFLGQVRACQHHQEGLPAPCGRVNARDREGRDADWRQATGMESAREAAAQAFWGRLCVGQGSRQ